MVNFTKKLIRKLDRRLKKSGLEYQIQETYRRHQLGFLVEAGEEYCKLLERDPQNERLAHLISVLKRQLIARRGQNSCRWKLIWQTPPERSWEHQWISHLLTDIQYDEIVDTKHSEFHPHMIVVDSVLSNSKNVMARLKEPYYAKAAANGCRLVLFHLSDEVYRDGCTVYQWCDLVFRNYWTFAFDTAPNVAFFPLGYKSGFQCDTVQKPAAERRYVWSFMGTTGKSSRMVMIEQMRKIGEGFEHFTSGWNSSDAIPVGKYRAIMDDTIFVPCPAGWLNLDTYRVYEALEAGCIPIVERRGEYDYFKSFLGDHPLPAVSSWQAVCGELNQLKGGDGWESLRRLCAEWWSDYKLALRAKIVERLSPL